MSVSSYMGVPPLFLCKVFKIDNLSLDFGRNPAAKQRKLLNSTQDARKVLETGCLSG